MGEEILHAEFNMYVYKSEEPSPPYYRNHLGILVTELNNFHKRL